MTDTQQALEQALNRLEHVERFKSGEANTLPAVDAAITLIRQALAAAPTTSPATGEQGKTGFRAIEPTSPAHAAVLEDLARRIDDE